MTALDSTSPAFEPDSDERTGVRRGRLLRWSLLSAVLVPLCGYLSVAALIAVVMAAAQSARFSLITVLAAALPGWLAAFQTPLTITGSPLSAAPMLPTVLLALLIGRSSANVLRRSRSRRPEHAWPVVLTMGLSHAALGAGVALLLAQADAGVRADPVVAFAHCGVLAVLSSGAGVANRCGLLYTLWDRLPASVWYGLRCGLIAVAAMAAAGALVVLGAWCLSVPELYDRSLGAGTLGAALGTALLSVLYVPDAVLAGWSYSTGVGFFLGGSLFAPGTSGAVDALPGLVPLLGLLPDPPAELWSRSLLALPAAVGGYVGLRCKESAGTFLRAVGIAALVAASTVFVLGSIAGGSAGGGVLDPLGVRPLLLATATLAWIGIPAVLVGGLPAMRERLAESHLHDEPGEDDETDEPGEDEQGEPDSDEQLSDEQDAEEAGEAEADPDEPEPADLDPEEPAEAESDGTESHEEPAADSASDESAPDEQLPGETGTEGAGSVPGEFDAPGIDELDIDEFELDTFEPDTHRPGRTAAASPDDGAESGEQPDGTSGR